MRWGAGAGRHPPALPDPCSKAQRFPGQSQPHSCPCPWHRQHQSPMHQRGWRGQRGGTSPERAGMGSCLLWLQRALVLGHPDCPPKTLCCCPRATPHPQELVACVVAPQLPKPVPSTLRRVYCWHEHSDLLGQGSPAPGMGGIFGTQNGGTEPKGRMTPAVRPTPSSLPAAPSSAAGTLVSPAGLSHGNAPPYPAVAKGTRCPCRRGEHT